MDRTPSDPEDSNHNLDDTNQHLHNEFKKFAAAEKLRMGERQRMLQHETMAAKLNDLKKFSQNFKLNTPIHQISLIYLAKMKILRSELLYPTTLRVLSTLRRQHCQSQAEQVPMVTKGNKSIHGEIDESADHAFIEAASKNVEGDLGFTSNNIREDNTFDYLTNATESSAHALTPPPQPRSGGPTPARSPSPNLSDIVYAEAAAMASQESEISGDRTTDLADRWNKEGSISDSDISDITSVFTTASLDSRSSVGSIWEAYWTASESVASLLFDNPVLRPLYTQGFKELGYDRFAKNHDRLLKRLFDDLRLEAPDHIHLQAIRFLQRRTRRKQMTAQICQLCQQYPTSSDQQFEEDNNDHSQDLDSRPVQRDDEGEDADQRSDDEAEEDQPETLPYIETMATFITGGTSFETFKTNFSYLVNPPRTIEEALRCRDLKILRQLLRRQFKIVAQGDYSWMSELFEVGYTHDELAELLFEQASDAPWIFFEPAAFETAKVHVNAHILGCIHETFPGDQFAVCQSTLTRLVPSPSGSWRTITKSVEELCGLAGVTPNTRDRDRWDGFVHFQEHNTVATVTCCHQSETTEYDYHKAFARLKHSMKRFCLAVGHVQAAGLCCDSFTILSQPSQFEHQVRHIKEPSLVVCQIEFGLPLRLLLGLTSLLTEWNKHTAKEEALFLVAQLATQIVKSCTSFPKPMGMQSMSEILHICSLATQLVCLGFVSYAQAHAGAIQPFFLDTPLTKVRLLGSAAPTNGVEWIEASLHNLTCFGDMVQSQVVAFRAVVQGRPDPTPRQEQRYNLSTNSHDLLDTWGPGQFLVSRIDGSPFAIKIGNGYVYRAGSGRNKYHWSRNLPPKLPYQLVLKPLEQMDIGTPVFVNKSCTIDTDICWANSTMHLEPLGPYRAHWEVVERQLGMQAGEYFVLQAISGSQKMRGLTLKEDRLQQEDSELLPFLDDLWGVQVSFCTRVARRVPLREMIADLLPVFAAAASYSSEEIHLWEQLTKLDIINAFQQNRIRAWMITLSPLHHEYVLKLIRRIFANLQHTGLDREGNYLVVAWPHERSLNRCFKVPCVKESSWTGVLADSADSATFAYITTRCLETDTIKCSGPSPAWQCALPLLETAVMPHAAGPSGLNAALQHNTTYYFEKQDHLFFVKVQKSNPASAARLVPYRSVLCPPEIRRRLVEKFRRQIRLRERIALGEFAEQVAVSK
ncbi:hypothetical protein SLS60_007085 [Paraconiothyrium brasiliense]|uniref:Uncharacterized protein n=1 Tax=Paraconiothyrium brasiliense TaxID=300254 RepID=A0ABR3R8M8_9PLEO